jgi:gamma-glutamyltranspeptidase
VQPQLVAQVAARVMLAGTSLESAQIAPRWTVQDFGPHAAARFQVEPGVPPSILSDLRARGHAVEEVGTRQAGWGPASVIEVDGARRDTYPDPRVDTTRAVVF